MPEPAIVVPVDIEALVVNDEVLRQHSFRWWAYNYQALEFYRSPEPATAGDGNVGTPSPGVYLSWTLPRGLRHGTQDPATGEISYPLVPNRWLVLRLSGTVPRQVTGWVIESDCPYTAAVHQVGVERTSMYLPDPSTIRAWQRSADPYRSAVALNPDDTEPQVATIGIPFALDGWTERAAKPMFLTAVAPGNPAFSAYAPHNLGVCTFVDDQVLSLPGAAQLSYLVAGWYSDPACDIIASWRQDTRSADPFQAMLDRLGWELSSPSSDCRPTRSYYAGRALGVTWDPVKAPASDPLLQIKRSGRLDVSIGNTAEDAFIALIERQLPDAGPTAIAQLRACLYGLLPLANQPNGDALIERAIAQLRFGVHDGGSRWVLAAPDNAGPAASGPGGNAPAPAAQAAPAWLDTLNRDQRRLDGEVAALRADQWRLNSLWWKHGRYAFDASKHRPPLTSIKAQLDPAHPASAAADVLAGVRRVLDGSPAVPQLDSSGDGTAQQAFQRGIEAFAAARGIPDGQTLKAVPAEPFWQAGNPVIMVSGVAPAAEASPAALLRVRAEDDLVTIMFSGEGPVITADAARAAITLPAGLAGLPELVAPIAAESLLIDPGCSAALAAAVGMSADALAAVMSKHDPASYMHSLPGLGLANWAQPWRPLFAEWQVRYIDVAQQSQDGPWKFNGTDYRCGPGARAGTPRTVGGISLLGPQVPVLFQARLADFVRQYGAGTDLAELKAHIANLDRWQFLSQDLTGLNQLLAARDERPFRRPALTDQVSAAHPVPLADVLGYPGISDRTPLSIPDRYRGAVTSVPFLPGGIDVQFFGVRQGQVSFEELALYDRFGRVLTVISHGSSSGIYDADNFPLVVDQVLAPEVKLDQRVASAAQLPPRLLQPARLDFALLDAATGTDSDLMASANPIGGWVMANHLDRALQLYAADGTALGQVRRVVSSTGPASEWTAPPHSAVSTLADVARLAPYVADLIGSRPLASAAGLQAFLDVIDATLWTTDPLARPADQGLSLFIGRPLALVRASVDLELAGSALTDSGWAATFNPPPSGLASRDFAVRLGDQATRDDGLVGYFAAGDYTTFNCVAGPGDPKQAAPLGLRQVGAPPAANPGGEQANYLWRRASFRAAGGAPDPATEIVMLLDPRGCVHATTGILPVRQVALRPALVAAALARLEVSFQVGAALTTIRPVEHPADQPPGQPAGEGRPEQGQAHPERPFAEQVAFPLPSVRQGTWSWWQAGPAAGEWSGYAVADAGTGAALAPTANLLADGILQLVIDASPGEHPGPADP